MSKTIVLIHTVSSLIEMFKKLSNEIFQTDVEIIHITDEILLKDLLKHGKVTPFINQHFSQHVIKAEQFGADAVLLTCSSIAQCVEVAKKMVDIPIFRIDEAMVKEAISKATSIGIIATAPTAILPLKEFVYSQASLINKKVNINSVLCDNNAYDAMLKGNMKLHNRIVLDTLKEMKYQNDIILLAQASMMSIINLIPAEEQNVSILSSPRLALEGLQSILNRVDY